MILDIEFARAARRRDTMWIDAIICMDSLRDMGYIVRNSVAVRIDEMISQTIIVTTKGIILDVITIEGNQHLGPTIATTNEATTTTALQTLMKITIENPQGIQWTLSKH